ncbi:hypothetical protein [Salinigranum halophilum]|uniref:hypothetical protein n=1 Tax=Salinigranum halophilum TaxID=2565931 RepID=UPI0010A75BAF|nr:hypothetical protein [Salinigranum halophilum]
MPQEAYSYNVYIPTGVSAQAQPPHEDPWVETTFRDRDNDGAPWPTASAAQTSINVGADVVVCLGDFERSPLYRTTPVHTNIALHERRSSTSDERFDFPALFAALDAQADPIDAHECRGGVLVAAAKIQTHTDTQHAFVTDLETACEWVDSHSPGTATDARRPRVRAALAWPTKLGQFHLAYEFRPRAVDDERGWQETVHVGFLLPDTVLDPAPYLRFFETLELAPPRYQAEWPHQELIVTVPTGEPPLTTLAVETETVEGAYQKLPLHASNPAYGVAWEEVSVSKLNGKRLDNRFVTTPIWSALRKVDSLRYTPGANSVDYREAVVDDIRAVRPPSPNSLWVAADVARVAPY